jgi:hypothetical protein
MKAIAALPVIPAEHPYTVGLRLIASRYHDLIRYTQYSEAFWKQEATAHRKELTELFKSYRVLLYYKEVSDMR